MHESEQRIDEVAIATAAGKGVQVLSGSGIAEEVLHHLQQLKGAAVPFAFSTQREQAGQGLAGTGHQAIGGMYLGWSALRLLEACQVLL